MQLWALPHLSGLPNFLVVAICGFFMRFVPGIMMGYITVRTTTVSEFVAAMKKLHLPEQIIIPMSVIFRFFPTVVEEYNAIGDAMKMRGIRLAGQSQCNAGIQACPCYHVFRQDRGRIKCGSPDKRIGRSGQEDKHLRNRLSCAGCFFLLLCVVAFAIPIVTMITGR